MDTNLELAPHIKKRIENTIKNNPVVLFMKGTANSPMCGFSARTAAILQELEIDFRDINILHDDELRQGLKVFSNWPTYPQLYIHGELIGGADIVSEMYQSGELEALFANFREQNS